jgi:hypothetical protein
MTRIIVSVVIAFDSTPDGNLPGIELIASETSKAVTEVFSGAGLELWGIDKPIPPVVPPNPPATGKRWRVDYQARLWSGPSNTTAQIGLAEVGDILTQVDDAQPPDWLHTTRGWLHSNQVVAV